MNNQKYISLKLSKLLVDNGCELKSDYVRCDTRKSWKSYNCPPVGQHAKPEFVPFWNLDEDGWECELVENETPLPNEGRNKSEPLPAYDILNDICVTYAKEFFGDSFVHSQWRRGEAVLSFLIKNEKQKAEDYIWEHCLFNPKNR